MSETTAYAPHETRMLALEMAVEYLKLDKKSITVYGATAAIKIAKEF